jgi:1,4-alpha-glucan branching enzyme
VALIGDFNAWDTAATPLGKVPSTGLWTVTVRLAPGRHTYAFMVDNSTWMLDPRAPTAQDPDFGTPSSVVLVGTP